MRLRSLERDEEWLMLLILEILVDANCQICMPISIGLVGVLTGVRKGHFACLFGLVICLIFFTGRCFHLLLIPFEKDNFPVDYKYFWKGFTN